MTDAIDDVMAELAELQDAVRRWARVIDRVDAPDSTPKDWAELDHVETALLDLSRKIPQPQGEAKIPA